MKKPRILEFDNLLQLANLFATLLVGVGVAVFLSWRQEEAQLKLNERQENFQQQLIALQKQAELTRLEVDVECIQRDCTRLQVRNTSATTAASNVRTTIALQSIGEQATSVITGVGSFAIVKEPAALGFRENLVPISIDSKTQTEAFGSAIELIIETLPPEASYQIDIVTNDWAKSNRSATTNLTMTVGLHLGDSMPLWSETEGQYLNPKYQGTIISLLGTRGVSTSWDAKGEPANHMENDPIVGIFGDYLVQRFSLAQFSVTTTCANCAGNIAKPTLIMSGPSLSFRDDEYLSIPSRAAGSSLSVTSLPMTSTLPLNVTYLLPLNGGVIPDGAALLLVPNSIDEEPVWIEVMHTP